MATLCLSERETGSTRRLDARNKMSSMGSMFLRSQIEADHLTCSICFNNFTRPKALPCLHTFCVDCLRDFVVSRGYERLGQFPCPMCRNEIQMPGEGVDGFPDNHIVLSLSDTVEKARQRPTIPPRPEFPPGHRTNAASGAQAGVGTVVSSPYPPPQTNLYPSLPKAENMPKPEMPLPKPVACSTGLLQRFGKYGAGLTDFHKPVGLTVGRHGEIVLSDHGGSRIMVFSGDGQLTKRFGCECIINDVSVTNQNTILVSVKSKSAIMRQYSMEGRLLGEYGSHYRYEDPHGIVALTTGQVAVSGLDGKCVYIFTDQFKYSDKFGRKGSGDEHFLTPYHVATNTKHNILVSDSQNNCIQVFNNSAKFKFRFGTQGRHHGQLCGPMGICTDSENNIIVADSNNHRVEMFNFKGKHVDCVVKDTFEISHDAKPVNVAATSRNNVVVLLVGPQFCEIRVYACSSSSMSQTSFFC